MCVYRCRTVASDASNKKMDASCSACALESSHNMQASCTSSRDGTFAPFMCKWYKVEVEIAV